MVAAAAARAGTTLGADGRPLKRFRERCGDGTPYAAASASMRVWPATAEPARDLLGEMRDDGAQLAYPLVA